MIIAGTGHRELKLGGPKKYGIYTTLISQWLMDHPEVTEVISGMALGWDQYLMECAIDMNLKTIAAVPFKGQEDRWTKKQIEWYKGLLSRATEVVTLAEKYDDGVYQRRNIWMVDNCDLVLAYFDGSSGGTRNCIKYAEKIGKPIVNLWPRKS